MSRVHGFRRVEKSLALSVSPGAIHRLIRGLAWFYAALGLWMTVPSPASAAERSVPIIFSTDLYHPADDPDDTFDTATLFALKEFDILGVILDNGRGRQVENPVDVEYKHRLGRPPLEQLMHITGKKVKFAPGLPEPLKSAEDRGLDQPVKYQGAVEMILSSLRGSKEKLVLFSTGSCRDFAAAFNREPELFRQRVKALYCVAGIVADRGDVAQIDFNVTLDPWAFFRMFETQVSFHWCSTRPKMSERASGDVYSTSYWIHEEAVIRAGTERVENYFVYALTRSEADPVPFLDSGFQKIPRARAFAGDGGRFMWSTAPLCHAAGRSIYRRVIAEFVALHPDDAEKAGMAAQKIELYDFVPVTAIPKSAPKVLTLDFKTATNDARLVSFHRPVSDKDYKIVMESVLMNLVAELDPVKEKTAGTD
jgi:hypothetical protein